MKKIFKQTLKFLFNCLLVAGLFISAQQAMNLPLGWPSVGCALIFIVDLVILLGIGEEDARYKGYIDGIDIGEGIQRNVDIIYMYAKTGCDEFDIIAKNDIIFHPHFKPLLKNTIISTNNYKYKLTSIENHDKRNSHITFKKI